MPGSPDKTVDIAVVGAGIVGIAAAHYLTAATRKASVVLIDYRQPMSYTSAQSGDNYRNWWPHPAMAAFTNHSIDLMQGIASDTDNVIEMRQPGYLLATRRKTIDELAAALQQGTDVEIIRGGRRVREKFPAFCKDIENLIHIRRAGDINSQRLGAYLLQRFREAGGERLHAEVTAVDPGKPHVMQLESRSDGQLRLDAQVIVNAAGPFVSEVANMLGAALPVVNIYQQKISFDDRLGAVPRDMPFCIDLDEKTLDWRDEERALLAEDPALAWLAEKLPPGTHCRPDGGPGGSRVKLGWAYNTRPSDAQRELANDAAVDPNFPEIVLRGAAKLIPALQAYVEKPPSGLVHYGGYYTMTKENWPLIGPMGPSNSFIVGALSGFGSMSACAAGQLCAAWVLREPLPDYARDLSLTRYEDVAFIAELQQQVDKGVL